MKITLAQLNPVVGDIDGNLTKLEQTMAQIGDDSDLAVFPELFITGYPPRDLLEKRYFIHRALKAIDQVRVISNRYPATAIITGTLQLTGKQYGKGLYNSAVLIQRGEILFQQNKTLLPSYDVFDESRYFDPAPEINVYQFMDEILGITICEDAWNDPLLFPDRMYKSNPVESLTKMGATLLINLSASPFCMGKEETRLQLFRRHASKHRLPFVMVNQIGGNDELIFDGRSIVIDEKGRVLLAAPLFEENVQSIDLGTRPESVEYQIQDTIASVYNALVLGVRDYMRKCGFEKAVLGISGGIDSALTCCIASEALGSENVTAVSMPSPYSSQSSVDDARSLAENLGVHFRVIPITPIYESYLETLKAPFKKEAEDETEENIQARIRGNILMAFSNKFGFLTLSSGNKSELSVGYCTLYGDMSGGLSVLADVPKTMVYKLCEYRNSLSEKEIVPLNIFIKPPSAELKPDQTDQDTLPPYDILDRILEMILDQNYSKEEIIEEKFDPDIVEWIIQAVAKNEYKRRQAAPGLKVTTKAFGMGRRMPIAAMYW